MAGVEIKTNGGGGTQGGGAYPEQPWKDSKQAMQVGRFQQLLI